MRQKQIADVNTCI